MWRWLLGFLLAITVVLGVPFTAEAATSAEVTITVVGYVVGAPGGLTLTYVSDYEVGISWTKGEDAENTMVRAAVGRLPESRTDGYLVYYGPGTSTSDWKGNLDVIDARIYYRAWSERVDGVWEEGGTSDWLAGGGGMTTIAIIMLVLGLTIAAYVVKSGMLYAICIPAWLFFTFYMFNINWTANNPYLPTAIAAFGVLMTIIMMATTAMHYIGNRSSEPTYDEEKAANAAKIYRLTHKKSSWED